MPAFPLQGMTLSSLFTYDGDTSLPRAKLQVLEVPVRAVVLFIPPSSDAARHLAEAARAVLLPLLTESGVWMQDPAIYHSSLYHASHHR